MSPSTVQSKFIEYLNFFCMVLEVNDMIHESCGRYKYTHTHTHVLST